MRRVNRPALPGVYVQPSARVGAGSALDDQMSSRAARHPLPASTVVQGGWNGGEGLLRLSLPVFMRVADADDQDLIAIDLVQHDV